MRTVFTGDKTIKQLYCNCLPGGLPNSNLLSLQPGHCNITAVNFLKSKSDLKGPLTLFGSLAPTRWNAKVFTARPHLQSLPPHLIPTQCTLCFAVASQMSIVAVSMQAASENFSRSPWTSSYRALLQTSIGHYMEEYLTMVCFIYDLKLKKQSSLGYKAALNLEGMSSKGKHL